MTNPIDDLKHELLAAAERRHRQAGLPERRGWRALSRGRGRRVLFAWAALAITAALALVLLFAPSETGPNVIERAQAALTPPRGTIAHRKWTLTTTSADFGCTVTRAPNEVWFDVRPPGRYRLFVTGVFPEPGPFDPYEYFRDLDVRALACSTGEKLEIGGSLEPGAEETLVFEPPNTLTFSPQFAFGFPVDPASILRQALRAGRAHDEGETELDGRTVVRIRIDPPPPSRCRHCPQAPAFVYVDRETFYPVEEHWPSILTAGAVPLPGPPRRVDIVVRYSVFEYLPRNAANLALANIKAQHLGWTR